MIRYIVNLIDENYLGRIFNDNFRFSFVKFDGTGNFYSFSFKVRRRKRRELVKIRRKDNPRKTIIRIHLSKIEKKGIGFA